jgi:16S rRNA (cytosine967-C5)-methyltransferase
VRNTTLAIAAEARRDWRYTTDVIARAFRQARSLTSAERREVSERVYGLVRMHRRIDAVAEWLLRPLGRRPDDLGDGERDLLRYVIYRVTIEGAAPEGAAPELARMGLDASALARSSQALRGDLGLELSFPDWLVARAAAEVPEHELRPLLESLNQRAPLCVRVNTLKVTRDELAAALAREGQAAEPLALTPSGLRITSRGNVFALRAFQDGLFEVQDEASQLISEVCAPPPRGVVIDACAGAGGKTLALAAALGGKGRVVAVDIDQRKLDELGRRARRAGLSNVETRRALPGAERALSVPAADRVLVDAPCSGLGVLRRNPEARWRLTAAELPAFAERQSALLAAYGSMVAEGGRLVYSTCTFLRAENEGVVERFLREHDAFEPVPIKEIVGGERAGRFGDGHYLRTWPHRHGTDGFFAAVLRRRRR